LVQTRRSEWRAPALSFESSAAVTTIFATWISSVAIFPCAGSRDEVSERALAEAFAKGGWQQVTRLYRDQEISEERCWLRGSGWCLAYS
jgi:protein-L-isoaspartate(D-aspartate) O-methyltransferase